MVSLPALEGVEHRFIDVADEVTIHVADAGPADGPAVMLVHGFPQNWWQWHSLIDPLAADGYRVLCPDLRGAGWSSAPRSLYRKDEMADDLAAVVDRLDVGKVKVVAHDWAARGVHYDAAPPGEGGRILRTEHFGAVAQSRPCHNLEYVAVVVSNPDRAPGHRATGDRRPKARYFRMLVSWVGGGFSPPDDDFWFYVELMREPGHAVAGSRWYRTFQTREMLSWLRGAYEPKNSEQLSIPIRWLHGTADPVIRPQLLRGYAKRASNFELELVDGVGHWIVEQRPDLVLDRVRKFVKV
ncbi:alpha/beta hydrolase fold family protein [Mycobacterium xenopi 4042]|uniref:Alpha/beta hydrolase fold family protein n=1 Tax=Mycobacterium xenopi 4042 TaxID=1299334 RepID=X8EWL1_MYCXE|nr:alpha/beta hydrolase fold family protein [Mycobacterium xenopi 4042]